jgi:phosphohistidine phosphatase SixA
MLPHILRAGALALILAGASASLSAQQTIFVVRHAERTDTGLEASKMQTDPDLSEAGKARAQSLAMMLKDAGIKTIYVTQFKRTHQTAEPLAKALGIQPTVVQSKDLPQLVEKIKSAPGNALVVGHSNSVGQTIAGLGVSEPVKLEETDFDNLFVVVQGATPTLVRLHFR